MGIDGCKRSHHTDRLERNDRKYTANFIGQTKIPVIFLRQRKKLHKAIYLSRKQNLTFASIETDGFEGNSTFRALMMVSSRRILSWVWSCPKGRLPKSIWYKITPADQTSTCVIRATMVLVKHLR